MWNPSIVFISGPLFSKCSMSTISSLVLYVCRVSKMSCAYLDFGLFALLVCMCSLYPVLKFLPVSSMYLSY
jgi:hypothetical protein